MKKILYITTLLIAAITDAKAQQGFGTSSPAPSSVVEMTGNNKGVLLPRVALTGLTDNTTVLSPVRALTVFNTNATMLGTSNDVSPGYYYWDNTKLQWVRLLASTDAATNWTLKGNSGTDPAVNFLGTIDNQYLVFKTNNTEHLRLTQTGRLVFANTTGGTAFNIFINGGNEITTGSRNVTVGVNAFSNNTSGSANLAIGTASLAANSTGSNNIALGYIALQNNTTGGDNVAVGQSALINNLAGNMNIAIGTRALQSNTTNNNIAIGYNALGVTTTGTNNTAIGYLAGYGTTGNTTGSNNTLIGANTVFPIATASNQLNISNNIFGTGLTGTAAAPAGSIGIGTNAPNSTLQVNGSFSTNIKTVAAAYTVAATDYTIICTGQVAAFTITLPDPTGCKGRTLIFANYGTQAVATSNNVTIATPVGNIIYRTSAIVVSTATSYLLTTGLDLTGGYKLTLQSNGINWYAISTL